MSSFSSPNTNDAPNVITINDVKNVMMINGINTINHDTTVRPLSHNIFSSIVNMIITMNFMKAVLYFCLNVSMMICVNENAM